MVLSIEIPNEQVEELRQEAKRLGVTPEELAGTFVSEQLRRRQEFDEGVEYVLSKNAELYERLS